VNLALLEHVRDRPVAHDPDLAWRLHAACRGRPGSLWFAERGDVVSVRVAKRVCAGCPVRADCLDYALDNGIVEGIWGGRSGRERRQLRQTTRL
jgi:WhiB family redox-sensing transcriptional regulator